MFGDWPRSGGRQREGRPPSALTALHPPTRTGESPAQEPSIAFYLEVGWGLFGEGLMVSQGPPGGEWPLSDKRWGFREHLSCAELGAVLGQLQNKVPCPQGAAGLQVKPTSRLAFKVLAVGLANLSHQPSSQPCYVPPHRFAHMPGIQKPPYLCSSMPFLPLPSSEPIPPSCLEQIPYPLTCP